MQENKCPHLEVKFEGSRKLKMGSGGISTDSSGWYCIWCHQRFVPVATEESNGCQSKSFK